MKNTINSDVTILKDLVDKINSKLNELQATKPNEVVFHNLKDMLPVDFKGLLLVSYDEDITREAWYEDGKFYLGLTTYNGAIKNVKKWAYMPHPVHQ